MAKTGHTSFRLPFLRLIALSTPSVFLPLFELLFLRVYLHFFLNLRIGFPAGTDFDYLIPLPTAFYLYVFALSRGMQIERGFDRRFFLLNMGLFFSFLFVNHFYEFLRQAFPVLFWPLWLGLVGGIAVSGVLTFLKPAFFFRNPNWKAVVPAFLTAFIFPIYMYAFQYAWKPFSIVTSQSLKTFFGFFFSKSITIATNKDSYLVLKHKALQIAIGQGCIGLESFLLFSLITCMAYLLFRERLSRSGWVWATLMGFCLMYFLNLFRIAILFGLGILLRKTVGYVLGTTVFETIVHAHFGWILYLLSISAFYIFTFSFFSPSEKQKARWSKPASLSPLFRLTRS